MEPACNQVRGVRARSWHLNGDALVDARRRDVQVAAWVTCTRGTHRTGEAYDPLHAIVLHVVERGDVLIGTEVPRARPRRPGQASEFPWPAFDA